MKVRVSCRVSLKFIDLRLYLFGGLGQDGHDCDRFCMIDLFRMIMVVTNIDNPAMHWNALIVSTSICAAEGRLYQLHTYGL